MVSKNDELVDSKWTKKVMTQMTIHDYAKIVVGVILTISTLVAAVWGFLLFVDSRVETKLRDPKVLNQVASAIRPVIFLSDTGRIVYDQGGFQYLEKIEAHPAIPTPCIEDYAPFFVPMNESILLPGIQGSFDKGSIEITPKEYMNTFPILDPITPGIRVASLERGEGSILIYNLSYDQRKCEGAIFQFRLELAR